MHVNSRPPKVAAVPDEGGQPERLWWRVSIVAPGGRVVEVDSPSGWTLADWQAYADRYRGPGCAVNVIAGLPKARAPVNLNEAIRAACERLGDITPEVFRSLLSPEDVADIEAGGIHPKTLHAYGLAFAEGLRSGRIGTDDGHTLRPAGPARRGRRDAPIGERQGPGAPVPRRWRGG
jgi:hypothetical protein